MNLNRALIDCLLSPLEFHTLDGLISSPAGHNFASRLVELKVLLSHPSHIGKLAELLQHMTSLETLLLEHLQPPGPHAQHMVVK